MPHFNIARRRVSLDFSDTISRTKQSHKAECDIHNILRQYQRTGVLEHVNRNKGHFTDLPDHEDYQTSLNTIMEAQSSFAALPAKIRDHFQNDPSRFLAAFSDPKQAEYLREVGLLKPLQQPPAPIAVTIADKDQKPA